MPKKIFVFEALFVAYLWACITLRKDSFFFYHMKIQYSSDWIVDFRGLIFHATHTITELLSLNFGLWNYIYSANTEKSRKRKIVFSRKKIFGFFLKIQCIAYTYSSKTMRCKSWYIQWFKWCAVATNGFGSYYYPKNVFFLLYFSVWNLLLGIVCFTFRECKIQ